MSTQSRTSVESTTGTRPLIALKSLTFSDPPFRKLGNLVIPIAPRVTIIAGHNGIGKSTILALLANSSGLTSGDYTSYFNRTYQANLNEIVHIDFEREWQGVEKENLPDPVVTFDIDGETLLKRCALTVRKGRQEVRVVPRNRPHQPFISGANEVEVGSDAKVPWPTLYLGMTRMLPIGESDPAWVKTSDDLSIDPNDAEFIRSFINAVIHIGPPPDGNRITTQSISGTPKIAKHPEYPYSTRTISLGQDSLSSIATALASFRKLKREWSEYPGGLLVIDELDAGFHPHAQRVLLAQLRSNARELGLQIVATTHSLVLIESVHPDLQPERARDKLPDSVVYLADTARPARLASETIDVIRRDMNLDPVPGDSPSRTPEIKLYLEDPEAHFFLSKLLTRKLRQRIKREVGVRVTAVPLSAGCDNLKGFVAKDDYFKTVVVVLDADSTVGPNPAGNICRLPGGDGSRGRGENPETTLFAFLRHIHDGDCIEAQTVLASRNITTDQIRTHLIGDKTDAGNREQAKAWFNVSRDRLKDWKIVELWAEVNSAKVAVFEDAFIECIRAARKAGLKRVL